MEILEMIAKWRKGCICSIEGHPEECLSCTIALIDAIENKEKARLNISIDQKEEEHRVC
jgi:hypothetical protein